MVEKPEITTLEQVEDGTGHGHMAGAAAPKEKVTRTVLLFSIFITLSSAIANFDNNYGGTVLLMVPFNTAFGPCQQVPGPTGDLVTVCRITALQQSLVSLTSLFTAVGSLLSSVSGTYVGRRGTIQTGAFLVAIGAAGMLGTSSSFVNYVSLLLLRVFRSTTLLFLQKLLYRSLLEFDANFLESTDGLQVYWRRWTWFHLLRHHCIRRRMHASPKARCKSSPAPASARALELSA